MHPITVKKIIDHAIRSFHEKEFQKFGDRLLTELYPDDYHSTRAGGRYGDFSNDGYSPKSRTFFHFYGPWRDTSKKLKLKMQSDVSGCLEKQKNVKKIVYITNNSFLGEIETHIDEMKRKFNMDIETWGPERILQKMDGLRIKTVSYILDMALDLNEQHIALNEEVISYEPYVRTLRKHSHRTVRVRGLLSISFFIITVSLSLLNILFNFSPVTGLSVLLSLGALFTQHRYLAIYMVVSTKEAEITSFFDVRFYKKEGKSYLEYDKVASCAVPGCTGKVVTGLPPKREKNRFSVVGYCSKEKTLHTYSINDDNIGYPVQLNFEPISPK
ncbi:hypothetical protein RYH73_16385 [Olivibacter sp. CPCC 100613]|uniref:hypothetical protein n=1 Tax=Olivibacter sp. CPCC 100613 TaxID=3079931 RepID=UPI002FFD044F